MSVSNYTFGDTDEASARLRRLAELYEAETQQLLSHGGARSPQVAVDLGCGPGWSTRLLFDVLKPLRTVGYDTSERYIAEARRNHAALEFHVHDVVQGHFHPPAPDIFLCRFLLTHVAALEDALGRWAKSAAPFALLFIHETESLEAENPVLDRYYELVELLQGHYGQALYVGRLLEAFVEHSGWKIVESRKVVLEKPAQKMAELHLPNLRTWRKDAFAKSSFDAKEIDALEASLYRIIGGQEDAGTVVNTARQIIARRQ